MRAFDGFDLFWCVLFSGFGACFGGQRFFVHGVRRRFGIGGFIFVIVVQRILQFIEFRGFDERLGDRFFRFVTSFGLRLRFFVLGFGKLFGERGHFLVGKARAVVGMGFRRFRNFGFGPQLGQLFDFFAGNHRFDDLFRRNHRHLAKKFFGWWHGRGDSSLRSRIRARQELQPEPDA